MPQVLPKKHFLNISHAYCFSLPSRFSYIPWVATELAEVIKMLGSQTSISRNSGSKIIVRFVELFSTHGVDFFFCCCCLLTLFDLCREFSAFPLHVANYLGLEVFSTFIGAKIRVDSVEFLCLHFYFFARFFPVAILCTTLQLRIYLIFSLEGLFHLFRLLQLVSLYPWYITLLVGR